MKIYIERNGILIDTFTLQADVVVEKVNKAKQSSDGRYHRSIKLIVSDAPPPETVQADEDEEELQPGGSKFVQTNADTKGGTK